MKESSKVIWGMFGLGIALYYGNAIPFPNLVIWNLILLSMGTSAIADIFYEVAVIT